MNTIVNKVSLIAVAFAISVAIGVAVTNQKTLNTEATGTNIYDYYSQNDSSLAASVAVTSNWVLTDANAPANKFTFSVGSNAYSAGANTVWLGDTSSAVLTGASAGQFTYGSPSLKALATPTNLTDNHKLYGFRMDADIDLTNYKDVTVTIGWASSGVNGSYTGFIAKSFGGTSEAWSLLTGVKQTVAASTAGSLSFTDTGNTVLQGQSKARFALILGSSSTKKVLKNIYMTITANTRKTLSTVTSGAFNIPRDYHVTENLDFSLFSLNANYTLPASTSVIYGSNSGVTFSIDNFENTISKTGYSFATPGNKTLYYKFVDSTLASGNGNTAQNSVIINIGTRVLTGLEVSDSNGSTIYKYDTYAPILVVYPLYDSATTHASFDSALSTNEYSVSVPSGTMLIASTTNTITSTAAGAITKSLTVTVNTSRTSTGIVLTGQKTAFVTGESFSFDSLTVTGNWNAGNATYPTFASSQTDGEYTVSLAAGTFFYSAGTQTITVSYYVNGANVTATYAITVTLVTYTFFNHAFTEGTEWGATTSFVKGAIKDRIGTLTNSVSGWTAETSWVLNTTADNALESNGAFGADTNAASDLLFLRFGTSATTNGPKSVSIEGKNFPDITNPENKLNGISQITLDVDTGVAGSLTVSVAGIAPTSYSINYGTPTLGSSTATTLVNNYSYYTFYFPYLVIGKIKVSYTNSAPQPGYFDLGNFSVIGQNLSLPEQVGVFANMLNNASSCKQATYDNLSIVYNYLEAKGISGALPTYAMTNHVTGGVTPTAAQLWAIIVARNAGSTLNTVISLTNSNSTPFAIILISLLGITAISAYLFINKRRLDRKE